MESIQVIPLHSLAGVGLGQSRRAIRRRLGTPIKTEERKDHYQREGMTFVVKFDKDNHVEQIALSNPKHSLVSVRLGNIDVFRTPAKNVLEVVSQRTGFELNEKSPVEKDMYIFSELELAFGKNTLPQTIADGEDNYFESISIGVRGHNSASCN